MLNPQFTYDNEGNAIGVFLPIEDWNELQQSLPQADTLPQWQKEILDQRRSLLQSEPHSVMPMDEFIKAMEKEADEEV